MGSFKKVVKSAVRTGLGFATGGMSEALFKEKKAVQASTEEVVALEEEKKDAAKKRQALYGTSGGVLGEEVMNVGRNNRGNIFGN